MNRSICASLLLVLAAVVGCANSDPIGADGTGGEGGGPWVTHGPNGSTSSSPTSGGKGATTGVGGPATSTTTGGQGAQCGDGQCDPNEDCTTCASDCGACGPSCGDGTCDAIESCTSCPSDCGTCAACGDGTCQATETCKSCYQDCGICACVADGSEPNNTSSSAKGATSGTDYCSLSICSSDVDWRSFAVAHGFTATLTFDQGQGDLDLEIYSAQTLNYVDGSYSHTNDESITLSGLASGTYWARIYGYQGNTNPDYCFRVDTN